MICNQEFDKVIPYLSSKIHKVIPYLSPSLKQFMGNLHGYSKNLGDRAETQLIVVQDYSRAYIPLLLAKSSTKDLNAIQFILFRLVCHQLEGSSSKCQAKLLKYVRACAR